MIWWRTGPPVSGSGGSSVGDGVGDGVGDDGISVGERVGDSIGTKVGSEVVGLAAGWEVAGSGGGDSLGASKEVAQAASNKDTRANETTRQRWAKDNALTRPGLGCLGYLFQVVPVFFYHRVS